MNKVHGIMASYMLSGYSLPCRIMRKIVNKVYLSCFSAGANICCFAYDGQWHNLMARGLDDKPHTQYQLEQEIWNEVTSLKKQEIIRRISLVNANPSHKCTFVKLDGGKLQVSYPFQRTVQTFKAFIKSKTKSKKCTSDVSDMAENVLCSGLNDKSFQLVAEVMMDTETETDTNDSHDCAETSSDNCDEILSDNCMADEVDNTVLDLPFVDEVDISDLLQADHDQEENITPALHILTEEDLYELRKWVSSNDKVEETYDLKSLLSDANSLYRCTNNFLKDIIKWLKYKYPGEKIQLTGNKLTLVSQVAKYLCSSNKQDIGTDTICQLIISTSLQCSHNRFHSFLL